MDLFFSPTRSCLASRITAYESGVPLNFIEVDLVTGRTSDGGKYLEISPLMRVPALRLDDGFLLTEETAILQHLAAPSIASNLAPLSGPDVDRLHQWLRMVGADLLEAVSAPLPDRQAAGSTAHRREFVLATLEFLNDRLEQRNFLLSRFSIADAYLCSVLNGSASTRIDLSPWPAFEAYCDRMIERPSVSRAIAAELALQNAEMTRHDSHGETSYRECA